MLRGEHVTQGQKRTVPPRGIPHISIAAAGEVSVVVADQGKKVSPPPSSGSKGCRVSSSKADDVTSTSAGGMGLSVSSDVVGRERNTDPGHGMIFSNRIPGSKSNSSCLRREFHPKQDLVYNVLPLLPYFHAQTTAHTQTIFVRSCTSSCLESQSCTNLNHPSPFQVYLLNFFFTCLRVQAE